MLRMTRSPTRGLRWTLVRLRRTVSQCSQVVETSLFQKQWPAYWIEDERGEFAAFISASPEAGAVVKDSGGIRKVRWKRQGTGKSGGVRVIYFSRNEAEEIVLLTLYAKSETDNVKGTVLKEIRRALED